MLGWLAGWLLEMPMNGKKSQRSDQESKMCILWLRNRAARKEGKGHLTLPQATISFRKLPPDQEVSQQTASCLN